MFELGADATVTVDVATTLNVFALVTFETKKFPLNVKLDEFAVSGVPGMRPCAYVVVIATFVPGAPSAVIAATGTFTAPLLNIPPRRRTVAEDWTFDEVVVDTRPLAVYVMTFVVGLLVVTKKNPSARSAFFSIFESP
jgi:hypothetical protein